MKIAMRPLLFSLTLFFSPLSSVELSLSEMPDQASLLLGIPLYAVTKAVTLAQEGGFRYLKILSIEWEEKGHSLSAFCKDTPKKGKYFEYKDEALTLGLVFFKNKPSDPMTIDVKNYEELANLFTAEED